MINSTTTEKTPSGTAIPSERLNARVPLGTEKRIMAVLKGGELRSTFFREAIENELIRREKKLLRKK